MLVADHRHRPGRAAGGRPAPPVAEDDVYELRATLNARLRDRPLPRRRRSSATCRPGRRRGCAACWPRSTSVLLEVLVEPASDRIVLGGTANLSQQTLDFPAIRPVLEALEEQVVLLRLLDQSVSSSKVLVRDRQRDAARGPGHGVGRLDRLRGARVRASAPSACSARGAWTTPTPWPGSRPSRATSGPCSRTADATRVWHCSRPLSARRRSASEDGRVRG